MLQQRAQRSVVLSSLWSSLLTRDGMIAGHFGCAHHCRLAKDDQVSRFCITDPRSLVCLDTSPSEPDDAWVDRPSTNTGAFLTFTSPVHISWISSVLIALSVTVLLSACSKAELTSDESPGAAGEFCVTKTDCAEDLDCIDRRCCGNPSCEERCQSTAEKLEGANGGMRPVTQVRRCLAECCAAQ